MFGGSLGDFLAATVVGVCLAIAAWIGKALKFMVKMKMTDMGK